MSGRSRYKRRVVERGRAQAKLEKTAKLAHDNVTIREKPSPRHAAEKSNHKSGMLYSFIGYLSQVRVASTVGAVGLVLAVVGIALAVFFGIQSHSPTYIVGPPIPVKGGQNPASLFHGKPTGRVHETDLILYSLTAAVKYASPFDKGVVTILGIGPKQTSWCASSYVIPNRRGVYRCEITSGHTTTIADPCFGVDRGQVMCQIPAGTISLVNVISPLHPYAYRASLSEIGRQYPWRMKLANGMTCSWNWLPLRGHHGGGWMCVKALNNNVIIAPAQNDKLLTGRSALRYNAALVLGTNEI